MQKTKTYTGLQHDEVEQLIDDAEKLLSSPNKENWPQGRNLLATAKLRILRERNRISYAEDTGIMPNIPPLEPAPRVKLLTDEKKGSK